MKKALTVAVALFSLFALAEDKKPAEKKEAPKKEAPPPLPPEVAKTVDAMSGNWAFEGTVTGMGPEPIKVKEPMACKKAAGGRAVHCSGKANVPGMGTLEDEALVGWDVEGKAIRFVGMSSTGEIHDHVCAWKDDKTMTCTPLSLTAMGQPATVDLSMNWIDAKTMTMNETTTLKDGTKVVFEGKGKR